MESESISEALKMEEKTQNISEQCKQGFNFKLKEKSL